MRLRYIAVNLLNLFVAVVEGILGLRFVLKLFGANDNSGFVNWVYEMSSGLLDPFRGIFPAKVFENRYVIEFSTLFAMLMYAVIALLIIAVINAVTAPAVVDEEPVVTERKTVRKTRRR
jgi:uncharacterized protein YggT (Ycf19 family)